MKKEIFIYKDEKCHTAYDISVMPEERLVSLYNFLDMNYEIAEISEIVTEELLQEIHSKEHVENAKVIGQVSRETITNKNSFNCAILSANACISALNSVMHSNKNAFIAMQPAGHHAESNRITGYCLFNNVALIAKYAINNYDLNRIFIFDFDVHHGNGTQEIFYDSNKVLFADIHRSPFYPGSGNKDEIGVGVGEGFTVNFPVPLFTGDETYIDLTNKIMDIAIQFNPELIIVSGGLDILQSDPVGDMKVTPTGISEIMKRIMMLSKNTSAKVIFHLEGGYCPESILSGCIPILNNL